MATRLADNPLLKKTQSGDFGVISVMIDAIQPSPDQARRHFDPAAIDELARSIQQIGLVQPIKIVKEGEAYRLVYGERRLRALRQLGTQHLLWDSRTKLATLPSDKGDGDLALQTLTENILRNDLSPIEEAEAYLNIKNSKHLETQQQVAELLGIDKRRVSEKTTLLRLPDPIKEAMAAQPDFTFRHARALLRLDDRDAQIAIFRKVLSDGLSVVQTERLVEESLGRRASPRPPTPPGRRDRRARLLRRFRRTAWQLVDTMKMIANSDDPTRREWTRRFGSANGLAWELRSLLDACGHEASQGDPARQPAEPAAAGADIDEVRPAE